MTSRYLSLVTPRAELLYRRGIDWLEGGFLPAEQWELFWTCPV